VPAVWKHFHGFAATWPVDYRRYPLVVVKMPTAALSIIELVLAIP
jgi:hypothetical protein